MLSIYLAKKGDAKERDQKRISEKQMKYFKIEFGKGLFENYPISIASPSGIILLKTTCKIQNSTNPKTSNHHQIAFNKPVSGSEESQIPDKEQCVEPSSQLHLGHFTGYY